MLFTAATIIAQTAVAQAQERQASGLLLTEVLYDAPGVDEEREWVEIANLGNTTAVLDGYGLGDEEQTGGKEGMLRFPPGTTLGPGQLLVMAQTARGFRALYGWNPDFEVTDSDPAVPDMLVDPAWGNGRFALANDGDEVLLLDAANQVIDAISYGDQATYFQPSIPRVVSGQSIARVPSSCDTDRAGDWLAGRPSPGELIGEGVCREDVKTAVPDDLSVGAIQGPGDVSPLLNEFVTFQGVVTGSMEDRNAAGIVYYTLFVQDLPGYEDGDPGTSDGIAVFLGRQRPVYAAGQRVRVRGQVTEFYGLTEIDDRGLVLTAESPGVVMPDPEPLLLPEDGRARAAYLEAREGMLVGAPQPATVVGPTHIGCGFAVAAHAGQVRPVVHSNLDAPVGVILVQNASDVDCSQLPQLKTNDAVSGVGGPLTYHFDQYKIVLQEAESVTVETAELPPLQVLATLAPEQYRIATLNLEDYLTSAVEEDADAERPSAVDLARKQEKLSYLIGHTLDCPTLLGVQEVESLPLLQELAALLVAPCGFSYQISHRDSVDGRGIDVALLTDPRRVTVTAVTLRQTCTSLETGVLDPAIDCPAEEAPLFSRPPLEVSLLVDNKPLTLWVTHFKSKRGGAVETAARRLEQAEYVHELAASALTADAQAQLLVLGDINDYDESPTWRALVAEDVLIDVLQELPEAERYSYIFDGMAQLIDGMFVSPSLREQVAEAAIIHVNADFPAGLASDVSAMGIAYRASDHDAPILVIGRLPEPTLTPEASPLPVPNLITPSPMPTTTVEVRIAAALSTSASATAVPVAPAAAVSKVDGEDGRLWPIAPLLALALTFGGLAWLALRRRSS